MHWWFGNMSSPSQFENRTLPSLRTETFRPGSNDASRARRHVGAGARLRIGPINPAEAGDFLSNPLSAPVDN
nr:hypothetical protein P9270_029540 [Mesorhizobium sp. WSM4875]